MTQNDGIYQIYINYTFIYDKYSSDFVNSASSFITTTHKNQKEFLISADWNILMVGQIYFYINWHTASENRR